MKNYETNPQLIKEHTEHKSAYDAAHQIDEEQQQAVNVEIEGVKKVHRDANQLYYNTGDPADEEIMDFRKFKATSHLVDMVGVEADTEDRVQHVVNEARDHFEQNRDEIHEWALDEADKAGVEIKKIPVQTVDEGPVHIAVSVK